MSSDYEKSTAKIIHDEDAYKVVKKKPFHRLTQDEWL